MKTLLLIARVTTLALDFALMALALVLFYVGAFRLFSFTDVFIAIALYAYGRSVWTADIREYREDSE